MPPPLFKPFRALGYITDSVPFAVQRRGKETFVTVSVGRTFQVGVYGCPATPCWCSSQGAMQAKPYGRTVPNMQVYNCGKLTLVLVGPQVKKPSCVKTQPLHATHGDSRIHAKAYTCMLIAHMLAQTMSHSMLLMCTELTC
eukprot:1145219-Pelagomonas_calceolata.AAC.3